MAEDLTIAMAKECKVRLKSSDDKIFEVDNAIAMQSEMLKNALADTGTDSTMLQYFMKGTPICFLLIVLWRYVSNATIIFYN
ncbi:hypothetical protein SUGI_0668810 [Cryptomeria japonica]|nr:hypothetical protein SUGI_0668480 [Cryptomeria japonica]GLJ33244.1 hypothetical protein SUGI_0668810 [Cryptomeria japonica]